MGLSIPMRRPDFGRWVTRGFLAVGGRLRAEAGVAAARHRFARLAAGARFRAPPAALWAAVPLLLADRPSAASLIDLATGVLLLLVLERVVAAVVPERERWWRELPVALALAAVLALAAAVAAGPGLSLLVAAIVACDLVRRGPAGAGLAGPLCSGLGAALRVETGALLLGEGAREPWVSLVVGAAVAFVALLRLRPSALAATTAVRPVRRVPLDLLRLATFTALLTLPLALASERGLVGPEPALWVLPAWSVLALIAWLALRSADRPPGGRAVPSGSLASAVAARWRRARAAASRLRPLR